MYGYGHFLNVNDYITMWRCPICYGPKSAVRSKANTACWPLFFRVGSLRFFSRKYLYIYIYIYIYIFFFFFEEISNILGPQLRYKVKASRCQSRKPLVMMIFRV